MRVMIWAALLAAPVMADERADWQGQAARVTIVRDDFGIPHIRGKSDADAVFGMIYAQAEDDFPRIEQNYLVATGRLAEADGEAAVWSDLRARLWNDPEALKAQYATAPAWLKTLCQAWADGLNWYLATHPNVRPRAITRFEPWMPLAFAEGSIGADIESVSLKGLGDFYGNTTVADAPRSPEPLGSNGFAIAPSRSADGKAMLFINPHTSFYFRSEAQVTSDAGLSVYGASTWGQFFVYQGWNRHIGWMHTTSGVDNVDEFALTVRRQGQGWEYRVGTEWRPLASRAVSLMVRQVDGRLVPRRFTAWISEHGPVVRREGKRWIATALMHRPVATLEQSWLRTRADDLAGFLEVADLRANSTNNTIFAGDKGEIAFLHPSFVARRDDRFDWTKPVDASDPAARWKGDHDVASLPQVVNPASGYVYNTNDAPWDAAGPDSLKAAAFPRYMDDAGRNPRGANALRLLGQGGKLTPDTLTALAYDNYLSAFADLVPGLTRAFDALPAADPRRGALAGPMAVLRGWDFRSSERSTATSLAVMWGETLATMLDAGAIRGDRVNAAALKPVDAAPQLQALGDAVARLQRDFGTWEVPWGEINRFQRLDGAIRSRFDDDQPSVPIGFASASWGSLPAFGTVTPPGAKRRYGAYGNSFVAAVHFGDVVTARAVMAGGQSGNSASLHFRDQVQRYRDHALRPVYLTPGALQGHAGKPYMPGLPGKPGR